MPVFKIKPQGGGNRVQIVHRNLLLSLLSIPLDHAGEPDNSRSLANQKETHGCTSGNCSECNCSHVHYYLGAYEGVQVTNLIQWGLKFVIVLFWKYLGLPGTSLVGLYTCLYR